MRGLAQRIDRTALPSFTQELGDPAFDTAVAMLKVKRPSFQVDSEHNHGKRPAEREEAANDYSQKSPSYDRGSPHGGEGRPRYSGGRLKGRVYLQYMRYLPFLPADETLCYINAENNFWYPNDGAGLKDSVDTITTRPDVAGIASKPPSPGDTRYDCLSLARRYMVGHDYMKCPMSVTGEPSAGTVAQESSATEGESKIDATRSLIVSPEGGNLDSTSIFKSTTWRSATSWIAASAESEARPGAELMATSALCAGTLSLETSVKTNRLIPRAVGKLILILVLTLLHFCVGAQALNSPVRVPPQHCPRGLTAALGCVPPAQAAASPSKGAGDKHKRASLLTVGEILYQCAWTAQRAPPQTGAGQDPFALLRALGGAIMYSLLRKLHASGTLATLHCCRQVDGTTEKNRQARLRMCRPGRCRLHASSGESPVPTYKRSSQTVASSSVSLPEAYLRPL